MGRIDKETKSVRARDISDRFNVAYSTALYWVGLNLTEAEMNYRRQRARRVKHEDIEGEPIHKISERTGLSMYTIKGYARKGMKLRQIEMRAQIRNKVPNDEKVYCGRNLLDLSEELGVALSSVSRMANLGVEIKDMPAYVEQHESEMKRPDGRPKRDQSSITLTEAELRRKKIAEKNNKLLAMRL